MSVHFDPPLFVPGVPSRSLRPVLGLLGQAERAGLLPPGEHDALRAEAARLVAAAAAGGGEPGRHPPYQDLFACLSGGGGGGGGDGGGDGRLPVRAPSGTRERRATGPWAGRHYSVELWCKAKSLGRQRSVLACLLAHLTAMRVLVEGEGDLILEDNVRAPVGGRGGGGGWGWDDDDAGGGGEGGDGGGYGDEAGWCECAERVWETLRASEGRSEMTGEPCHLRYYGWLGSRENVGWVLGEHAGRFREGGRRDGAGAGAGPLPVVFPFATPKDLGRDRPAPGRREGKEAGGTGAGGGDGNGSAKAGGKGGTSPPASPPPSPPPSSGVPIWGAYAYWISAEAYGALMDDLRTDVGSILWTSRKMRGYSVKPIDKVLPRKVGELMGRGGGGPAGGGGTTAITSPECIHVTSLPAFFRAPMLRSTIHAQWDAEFCVSTEYQLGVAGMGDLEGEGGRRPWGPLRWEDLWLTEAEVEAVRERRRTGTWRAVTAVPGGGGEGGTGREEDRWEARKRIPRGQLEKLKRLELGE